MAITKLIRTALDRAAHKELIDTKFVYFFEGLAVVLWSSIKVCTNIAMYRLRELCKVRNFSAENPSLSATCGSYRYKKQLKRYFTHCYIEFSFLVAIYRVYFKF